MDEYNTVSMGDSVSCSDAVSSGDAVVLVSTDSGGVFDTLTDIKGLLLVIVFIVIWRAVDDKISKGVRRVFKE